MSKTLRLASDKRDFIRLGKESGVSKELVKITGDHVFRGGEPRDLVWVWQAFDEIGIRRDLKRRWFHCWRSLIGKPIPEDLKKKEA